MIIAVDFDGVLCEDRFPEIGRPNYDMIATVGEALDCGIEVVLWTCRVDAELEKAVAWCRSYGLEFSSVNENAPSNVAKYKAMYPNGTRKVYADYYVDDHSLFFQRYNHIGRDYGKALEAMTKQLKEVIRHGKG